MIRSAKWAVIFTAFSFSATAFAAIKEETLTVTVGKQKYLGKFYRDDALKGRLPAVVIAPEWWGLTDVEKKQAQRLAGKGYAVLVADLYGNGVSTMDPVKAQQLMNDAQKDIEDYNSRFTKALEELKKQPSVDGSRVVTVGFGLGGGLVVEQARLGLQTLGVIDFFGALNPIDKRPVTKIEPEILVLVGGDDMYVPPSQVKAFKNAMKKIDARVTVETFPKVFHGFTRPGIDEVAKKAQLAFKSDDEAARKAWEIADRFLERKLRPVR